jgi:hypothetical protein
VTGSIRRPRPECPPWCKRDSLHDSGIHLSAAGFIGEFRDHPGGYAVARAYHLDLSDVPGPDQSVTEVHVMAVDPAGADGTDAYLKCGDSGQARQLAALLDFMASATPQQHRDLAGQIRRAAALIDGGDRA